MKAKLDPDVCWKAVLGRDASLDGEFVFAVRTTGIFCRPSCPARHPLRRNVDFFAVAADAEAAGFRPCLRCKPNQTNAPHAQSDLIAGLCRYIEEHAAETIGLHQLSEKAGLSPTHLLRTFRAVTGLTPKQYHTACRMKNFKGILRRGARVTDAIYEAGFGSSSRLYENTSKSGLTPAEMRTGGANTWIYYTTTQTELGLMLVAGTNRGLCAVELGDAKDPLVKALAEQYPKASLRPLQEPYPESFRRWIDTLRMQAAGLAPRRQLPLDIQVSEFQMRVYQHLRTIPAGQTQSYGEVAAAIGQPQASRAVGHACATNPVALTVPCHRVVLSNGESGGYRWSEDRKVKLLELEKRRRA
ncbi:MAG: bifunctional DNA-binding transcriptional regulator/O6-methylguanine-DNA methyltransferase Ada [Bryobacterales bacterium]|nr:bifunctional DNA-binding transcriptional regulator/O6-methylguanine-DNA methyltransferase Ada [Bryobacterales bacterium]